MAATGNTTLQLYYSTVAGHIPVAGNLTTGELAFNVADGIIYYKNTSNVVVPFETTGTPAGANTQVQYNNGGDFGANANFNFNGTRLAVPALLSAGTVSGTTGTFTTGIFGGTF